PTRILAQSLVGLQVGATVWRATPSVVSTQYTYDASSYTSSSGGDQSWNFPLVRSVRISLIGRSKPNTNPNYRFRNKFDGGPYQVAGTAIVVNPRNLSMND